jgi:hypothetical protein
MHYKNILKLFLVEIQFDYKSKYIAKIIYIKKIPLLKQKAITKIMNHNNQMSSFKTLYFDKFMF